MTDPIGYVYIYGGNGLYKIGRAKNVEKRIRSFPKPPFPATVVRAIPTTNPARPPAKPRSPPSLPPTPTIAQVISSPLLNVPQLKESSPAPLSRRAGEGLGVPAPKQKQPPAHC
jgi:hypothetical protein